MGRPRKRITIICKFCGKDFEVSKSGKNQKFCSIDCLEASWNAKKIVKICSVCGQEYIVFSWEIKKFCSPKCYHTSRKGKNIELRKCVFCGKNFCEVKSSSKKYCSLVCSAAAKRGKKGTKPDGWKHSRESRAKISEAAAKRTQEIKLGRIPFHWGEVTLDRLRITLHYRSSYELKALLMLDSFSDVIKVSSECIRIKYIDEEGFERFYVPDMLITTNDGKQYIIEIKPEYLLQEKRNQLKFKAGFDFARKHQMQFILWTEDVLFGNNFSNYNELLLYQRNGVTTMLTEVTPSATAAFLIKEDDIV